MQHLQKLRNNISNNLISEYTLLIQSLLKHFIGMALIFGAGQAYAVDPDSDGLETAEELALVQNYPFGVRNVLSSTANGANFVLSADMDGDGDLDVVSAANLDDSIDWYENDGSGNLGAAQNITILADGVRSIAVADINGDGALDVVSGSEDGHDVSWYQNDGTVNPSFTRNVISQFVQLSIFSVEAADIDADGDIDVIAASADNIVAWYENTDGTGTFGGAQIIVDTADRTPVIVISFDADGDNDNDVFVGSAKPGVDQVAWFENNGSGGFAAEEVLTNSAVGIFSLLATDLDGDNDLDLVSISNNDNKVAWYQNELNAGGGSAGWEPQVVITTSISTPSDIAAADFDGDGDDDLVVTSTIEDSATWFENDGAAIPLFTLHNVTTLADGAQSVAVGDLNGDTAPDVIIASDVDDSVAWHRNPATDPNDSDTDNDGLSDGDEVLTHLTNPTLADTDGDLLADGLEVNTLSTNPASVDTDADGSSDYDEVIMDGNSANYTPGVDTDPNDADTDNDGLIDGAEASAGTDPFDIDTDNDGLLDGFEVAAGFNPLGTDESLLDADGDGLNNIDEQTAGTDPNIADTDGDGLNDGGEIAAGTDPNDTDTDNDGMLDGFEVDAGLEPVSTDDSAGDIEPDGLTNIDEQTAGSDPTISDTDTDGLNDGLEVHTLGTDPTSTDTDGDGRSDFDEVNVDANPNNYNVGTDTDPNSADTDGDGLLDGFEVDNGFNPLVGGDANDDPDADGLTNLQEQTAGSDPNLLDTDSDGLDDKEELTLVGTYPFQSQQIISSTADGAYSVEAADLDGDGDLDAVSASSTDNKVVWYENDGNGNYGVGQIISSNALGAVDIVIGDIDSDGDLDVVSASFDDDKIAWYANDGSGNFGTEQIVTVLADGVEAIALGSINSSNGIHLDIVSVSSEDDKVAWYENDGSGNFGAQTEIEQLSIDASAGAVNVVVGNLDSNSDADVVVASYLDNTVTYFENRINAGGTDWNRDDLTTTALSVFGLALADIDSDGNLDVLTASNDNDTVSWFENKQDNGGGSWGSEQIITTLADGANGVTAADIDSDGDMDVISASAFDNTIAWYKNTSGTFGAKQVISTQALSAANVAVADLDGDGVIDVLSASSADDKIAWYRNPATDPADADSDDDGLTDGAEVDTHFSDPLSADSDGDGLLDGFEVSNAGFNLLVAGEESQDFEPDGLDNLGEQTAGTDPNVSDSDTDGLSDGDEVNTHLTDPTLLDTDSDGLDDGDEINTHGTDPTLADTDSDGLSDGYEVNISLTNPGLADTDSDGLNDGDEINIHSTDPLLADSDSDGLNDGEEINTYGTDANDPDTDDDGVTDGDEVTNGTDPNVADGANGDLAPYGSPDGSLDTADLVVLTRFLNGELTPTAAEITAGDVNSNGGLDAGDLVILTRVVTGEITLP